jgi:hypothetical protein
LANRYAKIFVRFFVHPAFDEIAKSTFRETVSTLVNKKNGPCARFPCFSKTSTGFSLLFLRKGKTTKN